LSHHESLIYDSLFVQIYCVYNPDNKASISISLLHSHTTDNARKIIALKKTHVKHCTIRAP
jgi:hypothetical protein